MDHYASSSNEAALTRNDHDEPQAVTLHEQTRVCYGGNSISPQCFPGPYTPILSFREFILDVYTPKEVNLQFGEPDWWTFFSMSWGWSWLRRVVSCAERIMFEDEKEPLHEFIQILGSTKLNILKELRISLRREYKIYRPSLMGINCPNVTDLRINRVDDDPKWRNIEFFQQRSSDVSPSCGFPEYSSVILQHLPIDDDCSMARRPQKRYEHVVPYGPNGWIVALETIHDLQPGTTPLPDLICPFLWGEELTKFASADNFVGVMSEEQVQALCEVHAVCLENRILRDYGAIDSQELTLRTKFHNLFEPWRRRLTDLVHENCPEVVRKGRADAKIRLVYRANAELLATRMSSEDFRLLSEFIDYPPLFHHIHSPFESKDLLGLLRLFKHSIKRLTRAGVERVERFVYTNSQSRVVCIPFAVLELYYSREELRGRISSDFTYIVAVSNNCFEWSCGPEDFAVHFAKILAHFGIQWAVFASDLNLQVIKYAYLAGLIAQKLFDHQIRFLPRVAAFFGSAGSKALLAMIKGEYTEKFWVSINLSDSWSDWK